MQSLSEMVGHAPEAYATSKEILTFVMEKLTHRASEAGEIRLDFERLDLLRALTGIANASKEPDSVKRAHRLVDVLVAGIQVFGTETV